MDFCKQVKEASRSTVLCMRAVCKVRELAAVRRCYAEEGGDCYVKL
jgi:hypothetical protein